ncbi:hypothetical protein C475_03779 [Halosimplex carlsbadense 2-9-1]|uniref:DUF1611 domain-containing protein n=1 Tax=Halosimplex carlsbadense 2-9-1 TaxID=797114 RepID=M0D1B3_9EURY|nr:DUF1611 domain-containing protein [Halosimplex carlsbadense]ELZ29306.1 hypothetical protein C475_03779 [Halosimplex carlsbadense 2-9-1]
MRVAILAHEGFPDRAKTAVGILQYGDHEVVAVLDRTRAGERVRDHVPDAADAPIVDGIDAVGEPIDALVVGIAPIGGGFDETWRPDVRGALERGADVVAGLHYFLGDDPEFADLADERDAAIRDLRRPPDDLTVSEGTASDVDAEVVLTVGTDCSSGKMTTTFELAAAARDRGVDAGVVPTGQTGIAVENYGIAVDRVVSDFAAGAVERMVEERAAEFDVLFVEGQGAIAHPAYSGVTTSILHGAMPDRLVLCHVADHEAVHGYEHVPIPPPGEYAALYESLAAPVAPAEVVAGALNTQRLDDDAAGAAVEEYAEAIDAPATDPVRFDAAELLPAVLGED